MLTQIKIGAAIIALTLAAWAGHEWADRAWEAKYNKGLAETASRAIAQAAELYAQEKEVLENAVMYEREIERQQVTVIRRIKDDAKIDTCAGRPIPIGTERMLERARRNGMPPVDDTAAVAGTPGRIAPLTNVQERLAHADCGVRYRRLTSQMSSLQQLVRNYQRTVGGTGIRK